MPCSFSGYKALTLLYSRFPMCRDNEALVDKRTAGKLLLAYFAQGRATDALDALVRLSY